VQEDALDQKDKAWKVSGQHIAGKTSYEAKAGEHDAEEAHESTADDECAARGVAIAF